MFGGWDGSCALGDLWVIDDVELSEWREVKCIEEDISPSPRMNHAAAMGPDGRMFVFGGSNYVYHDDLWIFDCILGEWTQWQVRLPGSAGTGASLPSRFYGRRMTFVAPVWGALCMGPTVAVPPGPCWTCRQHGFVLPMGSGPPRLWVKCRSASDAARLRSGWRLRAPADPNTAMNCHSAMRGFPSEPSKVGAQTNSQTFHRISSVPCARGWLVPRQSASRNHPDRQAAESKQVKTWLGTCGTLPQLPSPGTLAANRGYVWALCSLPTPPTAPLTVRL